MKTDAPARTSICFGAIRAGLFTFGKPGSAAAYDGESFSTISSPNGLAITEQDPNQLLVLDDSSNTVNAFGLGGGAQLSTINLGAGSWEGLSSIGDRVYVLEERSTTDGDPLAVMRVWGLDGTRYAGEVLDLDVTLEEKADFFLQPHRTSVVWGGQKALFIFEHHSGEFGLYYDLQTPGVISGQSGGGVFESCTIVMKNRIFIPVPLSIQKSFLPGESEKKRFEVRCDILHIDYPLDKAS